MKNKIVLLIILMFVFLLVSCNSIRTSTTITITVAASVATVSHDTEDTTTEGSNEQNTVSVSNEIVSTANTVEEATTTIASATTPTPASTINPLTLAPVGDYKNLHNQIKFTGFTEYEKSWRINPGNPYLTERILKQRNGGLTPLNFVIVTILGYGGEQREGNFSYNVYYVNAERYGEGCIDGTVYKMAYTSPESPYCGTERLEIGERYLIYNRNSTYKKDPTKIIQPERIVLKIEKRDGVDYVYNSPMLIDFTHLDCAIKITDETENLVYRPGVDDDIIMYMANHGIKAPTYGYKCKLDEYVDEMSNYQVFDVKNITPIGEYTSIKEQVPFESFAELPTRLRKDPDNPYVLKNRANILEYQKFGSKYDVIYVCIAGYIGEEIGDDGMIYSYYYVYADLEHGIGFGEPITKYHNEKVYIMKAYGSPAHPYYGQQRYEIGDVLVRLETDLDELKSGNTLSPTSLFLIDNSKKFFHLSYAYPDFNLSLDISKKTRYDEFDKDLYYIGKDDDIIAFMNEHSLEMPKFDKSGTMYDDAIVAIIAHQMGFGEK